MIQRKICLLGSFAVGKTSLVARFVHSIFSDRYLTTVGVKIDKKVVDLGLNREPINLMVWDIYGDDQFQRVRPSFLRGAAGYFLVADGTRRSSIDQLLDLHKLATDTLGEVPFMILLNKVDLWSDWALSEAEEQALSQLGEVMRTSAKSGQGVEEAFHHLTHRMIAEH